MDILPAKSSLFLIVLWTVLLSGQTAIARQGVLEQIKATDDPFDPMKIETAYQLPVKTVLAKESYQGGTFRVLARKDFIQSKLLCTSEY